MATNKIITALIKGRALDFWIVVCDVYTPCTVHNAQCTHTQTKSSDTQIAPHNTNLIYLYINRKQCEQQILYCTHTHKHTDTRWKHGRARKNGKVEPNRAEHHRETELAEQEQRSKLVWTTRRNCERDAMLIFMLCIVAHSSVHPLSWCSLSLALYSFAIRLACAIFFLSHSTQTNTV